MKHTGTIEINCGDKNCADCTYFEDAGEHCWCNIFEKAHSGWRLPECLETFKPEISEGKVRQTILEPRIGLLGEMLDRERKLLEGE